MQWEFEYKTQTLRDEWTQKRGKIIQMGKAYSHHEDVIQSTKRIWWKFTNEKKGIILGQFGDMP